MTDMFFIANTQVLSQPKKPVKERSSDKMNGSRSEERVVANPSLQVINNDAKFVERFKVLYNNEMLSDIILRVGDEHFYAHKFMLMTSSEVFEAMLNEERWRESNQPEITLTEELECQPVFADFLRYMYCGSVGLTTENVLPILLLADKYSIPPLREVCVEYMLHHIVELPDTNRTLSWYQYAKMTGNSLLIDKCLSFIVSNFDLILKTTDWLELTKAEMTEFLNNSDLVVSNEFELWLRLEDWLMQDHNRAQLSENIQDIIPLLRFTMIAPKDLVTIEQSELCQENKNVFSNRLNAAFRQHSLILEETLKTGGERFRNYTMDAYGLYTDLSVDNYLSVPKIESKVMARINVPAQFVAHLKPGQRKNLIQFEVSFWSQGHFTTFSLYGNHLSRQNDNITLSVKRTGNGVWKNLKKVDATVMLIVFGVKNDAKYVAHTFTKSHAFTSESASFVDDNVIPFASFREKNTPYLINGKLEAKLFIKIDSLCPLAD